MSLPDPQKPLPELRAFVVHLNDDGARIVAGYVELRDGKHISIGVPVMPDVTAFLGADLRSIAEAVRNETQWCVGGPLPDHGDEQDDQNSDDPDDPSGPDNPDAPPSGPTWLRWDVDLARRGAPV